MKKDIKIVNYIFNENGDLRLVSTVIKVEIIDEMNKMVAKEFKNLVRIIVEDVA